MVFWKVYECLAFSSGRNWKKKNKITSFRESFVNHRQCLEVTSHLTQRHWVEGVCEGSKVHCAAFGCKNNGYKGAQVSFFDFPKGERLGNQMILKFKMKNWLPSRQARLCSDHFEEGAFVRSRARCSWRHWGSNQANSSWNLVQYRASFHMTSLRCIHAKAGAINEDDAGSYGHSACEPFRPRHRSFRPRL